MDAAAIDRISDLEELKGAAKEIIKEALTFKEIIKELEQKLQLRDEKIAELLRARWCRTSEKLKGGDSEKQANLFNESELVVLESARSSAPETEEPPSAEPTEKKKRNRGKRSKLPAHLPRREIVIDIDESEKICGCGCRLVKIGEEVSEKLEVIPAQFLVIRTIRPTYACENCGGTENEPERPVLTAPMPPALLPKSNASPSLLACIATWKFQDALPLARQERIFNRHGIDLGCATLSRWMIEAAGKCAPIIKELDDHIRSGPLIGMDETPVQVHREPGRADTATSYMWLARGGPPEKKAVRFKYSPTRSADTPQAYLASYAGVLQSDAMGAYALVMRQRDPAYPLVHVGCMTHARRRFIAADKSGKMSVNAKAALGFFRELYAVERLATDSGLDDDGRRELRRKDSVPVLARFKKWLDEHNGTVPPKSLIGDAITYTLNQWETLVRYVDYGFVPIDNNLVENAIRPFVIGRKNFLFAGSPAGAESSATLYSIIETAKLNGHEPFFYLYYLFSLLPLAQDREAIHALLPFNVSRKTVQDYAAANWVGLGS